MKGLSSLLTKNPLWVIAFIAVVLLVILIYIRLTRKPDEGFYPVDGQRMDLEKVGQQRYNMYSDTMDPLYVEGVIPFGEDGQKLLDGVLQSPTYEATSTGKKLRVGPAMDIRFDNPKTLTPLPDNPELRRRIRLCESVKSWDCNAFNQEEFQKFCGICIEGGKGSDSKSKPFTFGGLYLDPQMKQQIADDARLAGKEPEFVPSVGKCLPKKFILTRPECDYRKDRWECRNAKNLGDAYAIDKCVQCQNPPSGKDTFVYVGTRNGRESNYGLNKKPYYFPIRFRLGMTMGKALVTLTRSSNGEVIVPKIVSPIQNEYVIDRVTENEAFFLTVEYESYQPYSFTESENDAWAGMVKATQDDLDRLAVIAANDAENAKQAANTALNVSNNMEQRKKEAEAAAQRALDPARNASNTARQRESIFSRAEATANRAVAEDSRAANAAASKTPPGPTPDATAAPAIAASKEARVQMEAAQNEEQRKISEQNRLEDNAGRSRAEAQNAKSIYDQKRAFAASEANRAAIAAQQRVTDAQKLSYRKLVCERPDGHLFTNNINNTVVAYGCGTSACCARFPPFPIRRYAIVGHFESMVNSRRTAPFDIAIRRFNGTGVDPEKGPIRYGTIATSPVFKSFASTNDLPQIPNNRNWVWENDIKKSRCEFAFEIPVSFLESTFPKDAVICPAGPVIQTASAAARLQTGVCDKKINGEAQGPGTYTRACVQNMFLEGGCTAQGKGYPTTEADVQEIAKEGGAWLDRDGIVGKVMAKKAFADKPYQMGMDIKQMEKDNMYCYGKFEFNPCDTPQKDVGPQTPECLDFLFRNAGKTTTGVGPTYKQSVNRSTGTGRIPSKPVLYCQRPGKLSPIDVNGNQNLVAINQVNTLGSVANIKNYYDNIHRLANYSQNQNEQHKALMDCYGIPIKRPMATACGGGNVRFVKLYHSRNEYMQISQVVVLNSKNVNVALDKPVETSPPYQADTVGRNVVDGRYQMKNHGSTYFCSQPNQPYLIIDLLRDENVATVTVYNRNDCCRDRSVGQIVQLLDKNMKPLAQRQMKGGDAEIVLFDMASGSPTNTLLSSGSTVSFKPNLIPSARIINLLGDVTIQTNLAPGQERTSQFVVNEVGDSIVQLMSVSGPPVEGKLVVSGFKVKVMMDDATADFKAKSSWKLVDSVIGYPGEISLESVANPGFYMFLNSVGRNILINNAKDEQSRANMSFSVI